MAKKINWDYNEELDIIHVYSSEIADGIKGCLSFGNFNIDIGNYDRIVGVEIEAGSRVLNTSPKILSSLDDVSLIAKKVGNTLFMGISVHKGMTNSTIQLNFPYERSQIAVAH